jgi:hypothetical protein
MPDDNTPGQQEDPQDPKDPKETLGQQEKVHTSDQVDWEARYKGSVAKVEQLTVAQRDLQVQLDAKSSAMEQLNAQLGIKDTEKDVATRERDKRLEEEMLKNQELKTSNEQLTAFKLKADIASELGMPELLAIAEHIPNLTDKEALTVVMKDFSSFTQQQVKKREEQILAGVDVSTGAQHTEATTPTSDAAWEKHINSFDLGTPERNQAFEGYKKFLEETHGQKL